MTNLPALGERTIWIDCDVIQADGGTRTASITGAFVALALALEKLRERDVIRTIPLSDYVAAISVGIVDGEPLLDLAYEDDSRADVDMNIVKTGDGRFIEVQGTAEALPFGRDALDRCSISPITASGSSSRSSGPSSAIWWGDNTAIYNLQFEIPKGRQRGTLRGVPLCKSWHLRGMPLYTCTL